MSNTLFSEFPPISPEQWLEAVEADLKGAEFEKRLVTKTEEGARILPLYFAKDAPPNPLMPGSAPYLRGYEPGGNAWAIREFVSTKDPDQANAQALDALMKGAEQVEFSLEPGVAADRSFVERLVAGIHTDAAKVVVVGTGVDDSVPGVGVADDPVAQAISTGGLGRSALDAAVARLRAAQGSPALGLNGLAIQEAGGSASQEVAYVLGALVDVLDAATEAGLAPQDVVSRIEVRFGSGTQYLVEIAKLRAARALIGRVLAGYGVPDARAAIHVQTSRSTLSVYDPHVNMLRATTQAMAAALGGADSIAVVPYDAAFEEPGELARRIARNVQIILRDESYLSKVADPLGGAYAIESLSQALAESAWTLYLRLEDDGGLVQAWGKGWFPAEIDETRRARLRAATSKRQPIVGTSNYPNQKETGPARIEPHMGNVTGGTLSVARVSEPYENLRLRADRAAQRPTVALLLAGDAKMRKARAGFATGFFAAGGYSVVEIEGVDMAGAVQKAKEAGARVAVLCSSDPEYIDLAKALRAEMAKAGLEARVVVAGNPTDSIETLKELGVQEFVHLRCDVVETLARTHEALGIPEVRA